MRTTKFLALAMVMAVMGAGAAWGQAEAASNEIPVQGKVDAVTVYRGQALVSRAVVVPAGVGLAELVVGDLPQRILAGSLFAEGGEGIEVRSVRYRERPVAQDVREDVRKLDDALLAVNDKLATNQRQTQLLAEERAYLDKLDNFAAPTATAELTKGVLNADQLKSLTSYQFETRKTIADQELKLQVERRTLTEQANLLARQKSEVTGRSSKTVREAVVFIDRQKAGGTLKVRYLVDAATWSPSYNMRADAAKKTATVEYLASIEQMSGEDWSDVKMTLSTASPTLVAAPPELRQLNIALVPGGDMGGGGYGGGGYGGGGASIANSGGNNSALDARDEFRNTDYNDLQKGITELRRNAEDVRNANGKVSATAPALSQQKQSDSALNYVADQVQMLELVTQDSKSDSRTAGSSEGVVVTYDLRSRTSLPSRPDRQLIQIDSLAMKSEFHKVAVPVLTEYVYDQAEMTNTSSTVLLEGAVASYVGGQFVGNGAIGTVAVGQPFTVGFGIDSSLRATRTREEKTEQTQGGNRVVSYTYRLALQNFGTRPADVRLLDRLPVGDEKAVRVSFDEADNYKVSTDKDYLAGDRKKGILRWEVQVPAQKTGGDAVALTYKFHLEHDKNLAISMSVLSPELNALLKK